MSTRSCRGRWPRRVRPPGEARLRARRLQRRRAPARPRRRRQAFGHASAQAFAAEARPRVPTRLHDGVATDGVYPGFCGLIGSSCADGDVSRAAPLCLPCRQPGPQTGVGSHAVSPTPDAAPDSRVADGNAASRPVQLDVRAGSGDRWIDPRFVRRARTASWSAPPASDRRAALDPLDGRDPDGRCPRTQGPPPAPRLGRGSFARRR